MIECSRKLIFESAIPYPDKIAQFAEFYSQIGGDNIKFDRTQMLVKTRKGWVNFSPNQWLVINPNDMTNISGIYSDEDFKTLYDIHE